MGNWSNVDIRMLLKNKAQAQKLYAYLLEHQWPKQAGPDARCWLSETKKHGNDWYIGSGGDSLKVVQRDGKVHIYGSVRNWFLSAHRVQFIEFLRKFMHNNAIELAAPIRIFQGERGGTARVEIEEWVQKKDKMKQRITYSKALDLAMDDVHSPETKAMLIKDVGKEDGELLYDLWCFSL